MSERELPWERWARERLAFLVSRICRGVATETEMAEADGLRHGLEARA